MLDPDASISAPPAPPTPAPPAWRWEPPDEAGGLGVGGLIGGAFRLYGRAFSSLFGVALVQMAVQVAVWIPSVIILSRAIGRVADVFEGIPWSSFENQRDATAFQIQLQEQMRAAVTPDPTLAAWNAVTNGVGVPLLLLFLAVLTSVGLSAHEGGSDSPVAALRAVGARLLSFLVPGVLLGLGVIIISLPYGLTQPAFSGTGGTPEGARVGLLLSAVAILIAIVVVYFVIRWFVAIPAMLAEGLGVLAGLQRSTELTHGIRLRILGALILLALAIFVVEVVVIVAAVIAWIGTGSVAVGVATGAVLLLAVLVTLTPVYPALTVVVYRDRVPAGDTSSVAAEAQGPPAAEAV